MGNNGVQTIDGAPFLPARKPASGPDGSIASHLSTNNSHGGLVEITGPHSGSDRQVNVPPQSACGMYPWSKAKGSEGNSRPRRLRWSKASNHTRHATIGWEPKHSLPDGVRTPRRLAHTSNPRGGNRAVHPPLQQPLNSQGRRTGRAGQAEYCQPGQPPAQRKRTSAATKKSPSPPCPEPQERVTDPGPPNSSLHVEADGGPTKLKREAVNEPTPGSPLDWPPTGHHVGNEGMADTPPTHHQHVRNASVPPGLGRSPGSDLEFRDAEACFESFKKHVLPLYPIINPSQLDEWLKQFFQGLSAARSELQEARAARPTTRKVPGVGAAGVALHPGAAGVGRPNITLLNALVFAVLAIGQACLHRSPVPGDHSDVGPCTTHLGSFDHRGHAKTWSKARDTTVGLGREYFAHAAHILTHHMGGGFGSLRAVYAKFFAGVYVGQFAQPEESLRYIQEASGTLQSLIDKRLNKMSSYRKPEDIQDVGDNQLILAFWSCLQLEDDLATVSQLSPSPLQRLEKCIPRPNMLLVEGFAEGVRGSYLGQLYMSTHLREVRRIMQAGPNPVLSMNVLAAVKDMLWFPLSATDEEGRVVAEPMYAMYWQAQAIAYWPVIDQVIRPTGPIDPGVVGLAADGIKAVAESARLLHNLARRPFVPNVSGVIQAQWGNLLVLSAVCSNPTLPTWIDQSALRQMVQGAVVFLRRFDAPASSLRMGLNMLEGLAG